MGKSTCVAALATALARAGARVLVIEPNSPHRLPALCANWLLLTPHGGPPHPARDPAPVACRPFMVFERAGLKIGVVGLAYTFSPGGSPNEVVLGQITVGGKVLEAARSYLCTGSDYITTTRAEKYFGRSIDKRENLELSVREAFEAAARAGELVVGKEQAQ